MGTSALGTHDRRRGGVKDRRLFLVALGVGRAGPGPVSTVFLGHGRHRAPAGCSHGRDAALLIPSSPVTGAIVAPPHARPPTLVACRKPRLTRPPPGTTLPRVRSGGTRAESGHHPGRAPGTYERSAASSCAGRGRSGHHVLVRELSETERLCPGQPPGVAISVIKTTNP